MSVKVGMKNAAGDVRFFKVGWSWTCFFFGSIFGFGIPWYMRNLRIYGTIGFVIGMLHIISGALWGGEEDDFFGSIYGILFLVGLTFNIFGGVRANELTIKHYFEKGYKFTNPESSEVSFMNSNYHIF
jgi:hypothetical protein